jgi:hypothetical protein
MGDDAGRQGAQHQGMITRTKTRVFLPCLAGSLAVSVLTAGCGSGKPSYCAAGQQLKTSVQDLGKINVAQNGMGSIETALKNVDANADKFKSDANGAFSSQTTALHNSLAGLQTDMKSLSGKSPAAALQALAGQGAKVKAAYTSLQSAWTSKCG